MAPSKPDIDYSVTEKAAAASPTPISKPKSDKKELLFDNYYYDVTEWSKIHPGGRVIEYYTEGGEDATIAIQQFHKRSTKRVMGIMKSFKRRPASELESKSISLKHRIMTIDFMNLYEELLNEGLFTPSLTHVTLRVLELALFAVLGLYFINSEIMPLRTFGIFSLAMAFGRIGYMTHEGGHHSITGNPNIDRLIQIFIYGVGFGMSGSWWTNQHSRHHAMPQRLHRDVDLETLPLLAFNSNVVKGPKDGKSVFVQYQAFLFLAIDTFLVALFWKLYLHPRYVYRRGFYLELFFIIFHYVIPLYVGLSTYLFLIWISSIYLFGNIALSHTHLPVTNSSLHWVEYAFLHTCDVRPSALVDWWMGYLNYQIEHHLFPTMPEFRSPLIVERVKALAKKHGLPYNCPTYSETVIRGITNLHHVAQEINH